VGVSRLAVCPEDGGRGEVDVAGAKDRGGHPGVESGALGTLVTAEHTAVYRAILHHLHECLDLVPWKIQGRAITVPGAGAGIAVGAGRWGGGAFLISKDLPVDS